ncbi:MAG: HRDC domain-containing protein [Bacteroidetes bacterium]|nr:HRDC domain-containing protein [Bacteroidota bacterium]
MKLRHFFIRLNKENLQNDQDILNSFLENVVVKKTATELITGQPHFWSILVFYDDQKAERQDKISTKITITSETDLTDEEKNIYAVLKQWRQGKASAMNVPNYVVAHNTELMSIAKVKPQTFDELLNVKGFVKGGQKILKYGNDIIAILNSI